MTDPLGQSQVLPYLVGLSGRGHTFTLISFEKKENYPRLRAPIESICQSSNIQWIPLRFSVHPPIAGKLWDVCKMYMAVRHQLELGRFDLIHCRSYISTWVALKVKTGRNNRILFDMRGFWVDERVEGGLWNLKNPFFRLAFKLAKKQELLLLKKSDAIVSLSTAAELVIRKWLSNEKKQTPIDIIPCSVDMRLFSVPPLEQRQLAKARLNIDENDPVLCYLGSIGTWYLLDEMVAFFRVFKEKYPQARFLFITPKEHQSIKERFAKAKLSPESLILRSAERGNVPALLAAADIGIMFIKPTFSKTASSPTKLGEMLASGIPMICNGSVGDVEEIIESTGGGIVLPNTDSQTYDSAVSEMATLLTTDRLQIRQKAAGYYNLTRAIEKYHNIYQHMVSR